MFSVASWQRWQFQKGHEVEVNYFHIHPDTSTDSPVQKRQKTGKFDTLSSVKHFFLKLVIFFEKYFSHHWKKVNNKNIYFVNNEISEQCLNCFSPFFFVISCFSISAKICLILGTNKEAYICWILMIYIQAVIPNYNAFFMVPSQITVADSWSVMTYLVTKKLTFIFLDFSGIA